MEDSNIFIVIPAYNRKQITKNCLQQLAQQKCAYVFQVIVVDDGSSDGTGDMIRQEFPDIIIVEGDGSWFWTASVHHGINQAMSLRTSQHGGVVLLNDDLKFGEHFIQTLLDTAQQHPNALVHASTSYQDTPDLIRFGGIKVKWWTASGYFYNRGEDRGKFPAEYLHHSSLLWGQGLVVPFGVFDRIGNYDLRVEHRGDSEFTRRAALHGFDLLVSYDAVAYMVRDHDGELNKKKRYGWKDLRPYFFSVHSNARVKLVYWESRLMTTSVVQAFVYFVFRMLRYAVHFIRNFRFNSSVAYRGLI